MSDVGNKFKTLINNCVGSSRPVDFLFATMVTPTQFQLDGSEGPIPENNIIIPELLKSFKVKVEGTLNEESVSGELTIDNSLKEGDRVLVLQKIGGQKFLILGRL